MSRPRLPTVALVPMLAMSLSIWLPGCSVLPEPVPPPTQFRLELAPRAFQPAADGPVLLVEAGRAGAGYASAAMRYTRGGPEVRAYGGGQWVSPPQELVVEAAIEALGASGHYRAVVTESQAIPADLRLNLQLIELLHDRSGNGAVRLRLRAVLVDRSGRVLLADVISTTVKPDSAGPTAMAVAAQRALQQITPVLVDRVSAARPVPVR